jgi:putative oxidoreductase
MAEAQLWIRNGRTKFRGETAVQSVTSICSRLPQLRQINACCPCRQQYAAGRVETRAGLEMTVIETNARRGVMASALDCADALAARASDTVLLVGRLAMGIIFFQSGFAKLTGLGAFIGSLGNRGVPFPDFWGPVGAISEFTGGTLIILGLGTRYAAALIVIFVIIATAISHRYWEFAEPARRLQQGQFFKNLAITGGALFLFVCGAGRFSFDALILKKR